MALTGALQETRRSSFSPSRGMRAAGQARDRRFASDPAGGGRKDPLRVAPTVNNRVTVDVSENIERQLDQALSKAKRELRQEIERSLPNVP